MNDQMPVEPKKNNTVMYIVIGVVVLCCCCTSLFAIYYLYQNGDAIFGTGSMLARLIA